MNTIERLKELLAKRETRWLTTRIRLDELRALIAAAEALEKIVDLDDGDQPAFWPDTIADAIYSGRIALEALK